MKEERTDVVMLANASHKPFDTRIFHREAITLCKAGYNVSIIIPSDFAGMKDGIEILAVPMPKRGWQQLFVCPWLIFRKAMKRNKAGIFHIHDSDLLMAGILLKVLGRKVVYDAHEDTPLQISYQHWIPEILRKPYALFYYLLEKLCGVLFDAVIVAEPVIGKYFPSKKTWLVRNFPSLEAFVPGQEISYSHRKERLIYAGALTQVRGLFEMLEAAKIARERVSFEFMLGGKFSPPNLENKITGKYEVAYQSWIPFEELVNLLKDSRAGIIIPHPILRYKTNYPVKLFEFMLAGLPVVASKEGVSADFVREANAGILVNPMDINEISEAIIWIFQHPDQAEAMGKRGQQLILDKYNWEHECPVLLKVFKSLSG